MNNLIDKIAASNYLLHMDTRSYDFYVVDTYGDNGNRCLCGGKYADDSSNFELTWLLDLPIGTNNKQITSYIEAAAKSCGGGSGLAVYFGMPKIAIDKGL